MVKAGKECKGFSPDDEARASNELALDRHAELEKFVVLLQAAFRGWRTRKAWREQKPLVPTTSPDQDSAETYVFPSAENTRDAALQYVHDHRILELFKNLLSRLFYIKPENVRLFLLNELANIYESRSSPDAAAGATIDSTLSPESLHIPEPPEKEKNLGIFDAHDFPIYFDLLAGGKKQAIPARQVLCSMQRFSFKSDAERILAKNKVNPQDTVDEKAFCRIIEESVSGYYDISQWT